MMVQNSTKQITAGPLPTQNYKAPMLSLFALKYGLHPRTRIFRVRPADEKVKFCTSCHRNRARRLFSATITIVPTTAYTV
mmetsp:Transcript_26990/g.41857  ORF Transcript_26990/g.41857 Transcript_26990/m.41857 type:complete len:80 (-) Transcript_26990:457-696(-)